MLTKKTKKKRYNKRANVSIEGHVYDGWNDKSKDAWASAFGGKDSNDTKQTGDLAGSLGAIGQGVAGIAEAYTSNAKIADTTEQEQERQDRATWQSEATDNASLLAEMSSDVALGDISWKSIRGVTPGQMVGNTGKGMLSGAAAGAKIGGPWGAVIGAAAGLASGIGGIFAGNAKARNKAAELNEAARKANYAKAQTMTTKAGALDQASDARAIAAYAAEGGKINPFPSSSFPSPVTEFNEGGSHEENPFDGIPQGIAPDGYPNLVEEGEVKYDNYIFSDRLMLSKKDKKKYKFLKGDTFADAAKRIKKDLGIDERPNDPIALADLEDQLMLLSNLQEEKRAEKGLIGENKMQYAKGGHLFKGTGSNWISSIMRSAPVIGNALSATHQAFNLPDYEYAKELQTPEATIAPIDYTPITQRMTYKPFDTNYYGQKLGAQAGATRRAIKEQTASNPYASTAALLSADANAQNQLGDLYKKAEEFNLTQREKVDTFNRATDSVNAEMAMKAQQLNATLRNHQLDRQAKRDLYAAQMKAAEDAAWSESMSSSLTSLFDNADAIGKEKGENALAVLKLISEGKTYTPEQKEIMQGLFDYLGLNIGNSTTNESKKNRRRQNNLKKSTGSK